MSTLQAGRTGARIRWHGIAALSVVVGSLLAAGPATARRPRQLWYKISITHDEQWVSVDTFPNVPNGPNPDTGTSTRNWRTDITMAWKIRAIEPVLVYHEGRGDLRIETPSQAVAHITRYSLSAIGDELDEPPCPWIYGETLTSGGPLFGLIGTTPSSENLGIGWMVGERASTQLSSPARTCTEWRGRVYSTEEHYPAYSGPGTVHMWWQGTPHFAVRNQFGKARMVARRPLSTVEEHQVLRPGHTGSTTRTSTTTFVFKRCRDQQRPESC
jgi:hypothetical protein